MNLYKECESFYNDFSIWIRTKWWFFRPYPYKSAQSVCCHWWIRMKYAKIFSSESIQSMRTLLWWFLSSESVQILTKCVLSCSSAETKVGHGPPPPHPRYFQRHFCFLHGFKCTKRFLVESAKNSKQRVKFSVDFSTELLQSTWLVDQSGNWNSLVRGGQISNDYYGTNKQNHTETCISKVSHCSCAKFGGRARPMGNNFQ